MNAVQPAHGHHGRNPAGPRSVQAPPNPAAFPTFLANLSDLLQSIFAASNGPAKVSELAQELGPSMKAEKSAKPAEEEIAPRAEPEREVERVEEEEEGTAPVETETVAAPEDEHEEVVAVVEAPKAAPIEAAPPAEEAPVAPVVTAETPVEAPIDEATGTFAPRTQPVAAPGSEETTEPEVAVTKPETAPAPVSTPEEAPEFTAEGKAQTKIELPKIETPEPPPPPAAKVETPPPPPAPPNPAQVQLPPMAAAIAEVRVESTPSRADGESRSIPSGGREIGSAIGKSTRAGTAPPDTNRVEFVERLMKAARMTMLKGQSRMKFVLNPPHLGSLKVDLALKEHVLNGTLRTESTVARDLILSHLQTLKDELEKQGIHVGSFDVHCDAQAHPQGERPTPGREPGPAAPAIENAEARPERERPRSSRVQVIDVMA